MRNEKTFTLTISKVNEQLFNGEAFSVSLPGSEGMLTILAHHEPLVSLLKKGTIVVRQNEGTREFNIEKGLLETSNNQVSILV